MHVHDWQNYLSNDLNISRSSLFSNEEYFDLEAYSSSQNNNLACTYIENLAVIKLSGADAQSFLQGQLSCDIENINEELSGIGTHNDVKGRMLSSFRVIQCAEDEFLLAIHCSIVESCIAQLKKYAVFSKVEITHDTSQICFGLIGAWPQALSLSSSGYLKQQNHEFGKVIQIDEPGERFLLIADTKNIQQTFEQLREMASLKNLPTWTLADINAGIAWVEQASSDEHIAQTFNYHLIGGISFTKGCYIGQEIIIRAQHRGTLKRQLFFIKLNCEKTFATNSKILLAGKTTGFLVSNTINKNKGLYGLAVLQNSVLDQDIKELSINEQDIPVLEVKSLQTSGQNN